MLITINDYQRLNGMIEFASLKKKLPEIVNRLRNEFKAAQMLSQQEISGDVITMNSRIVVKDLVTGREAEITITYPQDADSREGKVSIFSPIGVALLGRKLGDCVSWQVPNGTGRFEVSKISYQPEAVGDYYL